MLHRSDSPGMTLIDVPPGLAGVAVTDTTLGDVRGLEGFYHYRQYSAVELATTRSLEDVWYLLYEGALPTHAERESLAATIAPLFVLPDAVRDVLPSIATSGNPLNELRTVVSLSGSALGLR